MPEYNNNEFANLENKDLLHLLAKDFSELPDRCCYARFCEEMAVTVGTPEHENYEKDGMGLLLLTRGHITVFHEKGRIGASAPALVPVKKGARIQLEGLSDGGPVDCHMLLMSQLFLQNLKISFTSISSDAFMEHNDPVLMVNDEEKNLIIRYLALMHSVMGSQGTPQLAMHIMSELASALFYQVLSFIYRRVELTHQRGVSPRRSSYVEDFLRLLHIHYIEERSISFYADKLFISPKYLSLLVKEATGRSAARWIDYFVIMEAKNMLRYSGKNVQQVAYALNFSNQSAFGKYFKHITGMSPTEFQKMV